MFEIKCKQCGNNATVSDKRIKYCSDTCRRKAYRPKVKRECTYCGAVYDSQRLESLFCSRECKAQYQYDSSEIHMIKLYAEIVKFISDGGRQLAASTVARSVGISETKLHRILGRYGQDYEQLCRQTLGEYDYNSGATFTSKSAELVFSILDEYFNTKGKREAVFKDLVNPNTGRNFRVDYFIESLPLAVEYNGIQHCKESPFFKGRTLREQQEIDHIKKHYFNSRNIPLVVFAYNDDLSREAIIQRVEEALHRNIELIPCLR